MYKTPIVEVKNLNSFRSLERTVEYEIQRQYAQWKEDPDGYAIEKLGKQNRGFDDQRQITVFQREKEEAHDYRYFPDPDLVPVCVDDAWRGRVAATIGELPLARRARYVAACGLSFKEADALTQDAPTGDLMDAAVAAGASPKRVANFLLGRISAVANERACTPAAVGLTAGQLAELAKMVDASQINATAADKVLEAMIGHTGGPPSAASPAQIAKDLNLLAVTDDSAIEAWVDAAIAAHAGPAEQVRGGDKKAKQAFGFLMGAVMKLSGGKAPPATVKRLLESKLTAKSLSE